MSDQTTPTPAKRQQIIIYGLRERFDCRIRYIGKTIHPKRRLIAHCKEKKGHSHRIHWIQSVLKRGGTIEIVLLQKVPFWAKWQECEKMWIDHGWRSGWPLTNATEGGEGVNLTAEARAKMRKTWLGRKHKPESLIKIGLASKGRTHTEEYKTFMRERMRVRTFSPQHRQRLSDAAKDQKKKRKFTAEMIFDIQSRLANGEKSMDLAKEFGVNQRTIWLIKSGRIYKGKFNA